MVLLTVLLYLCAGAVVLYLFDRRTVDVINQEYQILSEIQQAELGLRKIRPEGMIQGVTRHLMSPYILLWPVGLLSTTASINFHRENAATMIKYLAAFHAYPYLGKTIKSTKKIYLPGYAISYIVQEENGVQTLFRSIVLTSPNYIYRAGWATTKLYQSVDDFETTRGDHVHEALPLETLTYEQIHSFHQDGASSIFTLTRNLRADRAYSGIERLDKRDSGANETYGLADITPKDQADRSAMSRVFTSGRILLVVGVAAAVVVFGSSWLERLWPPSPPLPSPSPCSSSNFMANGNVPAVFNLVRVCDSEATKMFSHFAVTLPWHEIWSTSSNINSDEVSNAIIENIEKAGYELESYGELPIGTTIGNVFLFKHSSKESFMVYFLEGSTPTQVWGFTPDLSNNP